MFRSDRIFSTFEIAMAKFAGKIERNLFIRRREMRRQIVDEQSQTIKSRAVRRMWKNISIFRIFEDAHANSS